MNVHKSNWPFEFSCHLNLCFIIKKWEILPLKVFRPFVQGITGSTDYFFLFNSPSIIQFAFGDMHNCISSLTTGFCQFFFFLDLLFQFEQGLVCLAVQCGLTRTDILMFIVLMIWSSPCRRQCTKSNIMTCALVLKRVVAFPVHYGFFL